MLCMLHIKGGGSSSMRQNLQAQESEANGRELRVNIVRLAVAFAVVLKTYTRIGLDGYCFGRISKETKWCIDWDRLRLRQLLREDEFELMDRCVGIVWAGAPAGRKSPEALAAQFHSGESGPPASWPESFEVSTDPTASMYLALVYLLRELLVRNLNEFQNNVPWGIKERFVPMLSKILASAQLSFEMVVQILTTPLPLSYACLCKTLLTCWMASFPFTVDFSLGYFGGVAIPILIVLALLGIDAIATELENPFGDDANDLDILELIHNLEGEAMEVLELCGDSGARARFVWRRMPAFITEMSSKPVRHHLAVAEFATDEVVPSGSATPASSQRSGSQRSGSSLARSSENI